MSDSNKILQDLTYLLIGMNQRLKYAEESINSENHILKMMAKARVATLNIEISAIKNIIKKEEKRIQREKERKPHRQAAEPLTAKMVKKYSNIK